MLSRFVTKRARSRLGLAVLGAVMALGIGAMAVFAGGQADFSVAGSPSSQTVTQGQTATYTVTVTRVNGFTGSVTLSASNLPSGTGANWKLPNGTSSNVVPANVNSATLTISTTAGTPKGTSEPLITAVSGKLTRTTAVTLVVQPATQPNFTLSASPATRTVAQGEQTSYGVSVNRVNGFSGAVALSVTGAPKQATASWAPGSTVSASTATLGVQTATNTQEDNYSLTVTGEANINGSPVTRFATVTLVVQKSQDFTIAGEVQGPLFPGRRVPTNLSLTNPNNFTVQVTSLAVAVEEATGNPGCSGTENFRVVQIPVGRYPITLGANQTRTLTELGVADADKPQVEMLDRPWNQDACKNAGVTLAYSGSATK